MGKVWNDEMKAIMRKKRTIYKSPLPRKKQQMTCYRGRAGKVKVFTDEEIFLFNMQRMPRLFDY